MNAPAGITVSGLTKRFGRTPHAVLDAVDLTAYSGTLTLIHGAPGVGKSTLVRCLTGVYRPDVGTVRYRLGAQHVDVTAAEPRAVAWLRTYHLAAFDGPPAAAPSVPAAVVVARAAGCSRADAVAALHRLGSADIAPVTMGRLRTAGRHTVSLASALLAEGPFIVLDTPESCGDRGALTDWLRAAVAAGAAVVVTAAQDSSLHTIATAVGELRKGRIQWQEP